MRKGIMRVVCTYVLIGLAACSGGGSSSGGGSAADTMIVTITDQSTSVTTTYTEAGFNTYGYLDPNLSSHVTTSADTWVLLSTGSTGSSIDLSINIAVRGNTPGSYPTGTTASSTFISYTTYTTGIQSYNSQKSSSTGTITLTSVGNVGEMITGSFDAIVTHISYPTDTRGISGTFSVKREH